MKKFLIIMLLSFLSSGLIAQNIIVWDFENNIFCFNNVTRVMSSLLIDELIKINGITVIEHRNRNDIIKELEFQNGIYTDGNTFKSVGKMLNADYIITGDTCVIEGKLLATARIIEVETGKIFNSAKMKCYRLDDLDKDISFFAKEIVSELSCTNPLLGKWLVCLDDVFYEISFLENKKCTVIEMSAQNIKTDELFGDYSSGIDKFSGAKTLKIVTNSKKKSKNICWSGFYNFTDKVFSSFNMLIKNKQGKTVRINFIKD